MASKFSLVPRILVCTAAVVYPAFIFYFLVIHKTPIRLLSLFVIGFALLAFIGATSKKKATENIIPFFGPPFSFLV